MPGRRIGALLLLSLPIVASVLSSPSLALAAHPCNPVRVGPESSRARVAVVSAGCPLGREVAIAAYERIEAIDEADGYATRFKAAGFGCAAVLAQTEVSCHRHKEWVFASTQLTDHPGEWHVPTTAQHQCIDVHTKKITGREVETTAHLDCQGARKIMRKYFHLVVATAQTVGGCAQARGSKGCKIGTYRCYTRYRRATNDLHGVCKGRPGRVRFLEIDRWPN
jgi:hypothetical protein